MSGNARSGRKRPRPRGQRKVAGGRRTRRVGPRGADGLWIYRWLVGYLAAATEGEGTYITVYCPLTDTIV